LGASGEIDASAAGALWSTQ